MTSAKNIHEGTLANQGRPVGEIDPVAKAQVGDIEIPPKGWVAFLDSFSLQHEGWLASLSVNHGSKVSLLASMCRLQRVAIDCAREKRCVNISVLEGREERIHSVPDPLHLTFKRDSTGAHQGLEMTSIDGSVTMLRFRAAVRPESLDGVLGSLSRPLRDPIPEFCGREANA